MLNSDNNTHLDIAPGTPPRLRLGAMVKRLRLISGKRLKDVCDVIGDKNITIGMLRDIENGMRPISWSNLECLCNYFRVDSKPYYEALVQFHHNVWKDNNEKGVILDEQTERLSVVVKEYDITELTSALCNAIISMDIANCTIREILDIIDDKIDENKIEKIHRAIFILEASIFFSKTIMGIKNS